MPYFQSQSRRNPGGSAALSRSTSASVPSADYVTLARTANMSVERATYAAVPGGKIKGYHLIGQTPGIDKQVGLELARWAPALLADDQSNDLIVSAWTLRNGMFAIARTIHDAAASTDDETKIATQFLLLRDEQFHAYACNAMAVARTVVELGYWRDEQRLATGSLSLVELPTVPPESVLSAVSGFASDAAYSQLIDDVALILAQSRPAAVIGLSNPNAAMQQLITRLSIDIRQRLSFTTGLSPSIRRPLQMHFLSRPDVARQRVLESQQVVCFRATPDQRAGENRYRSWRA